MKIQKLVEQNIIYSKIGDASSLIDEKFVSIVVFVRAFDDESQSVDYLEAFQLQEPVSSVDIQPCSVYSSVRTMKRLQVVIGIDHRIPGSRERLSS